MIVLPFGAGYMLSYFLRNVNAVLAPAMVDELQLSASQIGFLTSLYFFAAAAVLVPVAIALDRWGPRRVFIAQVIVTFVGVVLTASAASMIELMASRVLIGLGVAGCLATEFKAVTIWFPERLWATGNAMMLAVGSLGVIASTRPLQFALVYFEWRAVFVLVATICVLLLIVVVTIVPEVKGPVPAQKRSSASIYWEVVSEPVFWRIMPVCALSMATYFAIQGLWGTPWMVDVAGLSQVEVGRRLLAMALAMSLGMLLNGLFADVLISRGVSLSIVTTTGLVLFFAAELALILEWQPASFWPWLVMGYTGNIGALAFPQLSRRFARSSAARAMSVMAFCNFSMAFVVQYIIGVILDKWPSTNGHYPSAAYQTALGGLLAVQVVFYLISVVARGLGCYLAVAGSRKSEQFSGAE
jgi:predicted MFS family arabinose efflux permease